MKENPALFALLIDGDNIQASFVLQILDELKNYGKTIFRRVYLSNPSKSWTSIINEYSLKAMWVTNNTVGKNAADIALVIDAMDLLYNNENLTGFCIASSDSDFTTLARYLEEKGKKVIGIGISKTPTSFQRACSDFIDMESLSTLQIPIEQPENSSNQEKDKPDDVNIDEIFETLLIQAYDKATKNNDGWVQLNEIKEIMKSMDNEFQSKDYRNGRQFAEKIKQLAMFYPIGVMEVDEQLDSKPVIHHVRIDCDTFRFIKTYKQSLSLERDGWISLSAIGTELRKYPIYENGFSYRGRKQLLKIVIEMMKDYPNVIELKDESDDKTKIYFVRIK